LIKKKTPTNNNMLNNTVMYSVASFQQIVGGESQ